MIKAALEHVAGLIFGAVAAHYIGNWAISYSYHQRGYDAIGGEYLLIPMVFIVAYVAMYGLLKGLEAANDVRSKHHKRSDSRSA